MLGFILIVIQCPVSNIIINNQLSPLIIIIIIIILTDEDYEILSELPDTVEYMCTFCYTNNDDSHDGGVSWRTAIIEFKRDSYNKVYCNYSNHCYYSNHTAIATILP